MGANRIGMAKMTEHEIRYALSAHSPLRVTGGGALGWARMDDDGHVEVMWDCQVRTGLLGDERIITPEGLTVSQIEAYAASLDEPTVTARSPTGHQKATPGKIPDDLRRAMFPATKVIAEACCERCPTCAQPIITIDTGG